MTDISAAVAPQIVLRRDDLMVMLAAIAKHADLDASPQMPPGLRHAIQVWRAAPDGAMIDLVVEGSTPWMPPDDTEATA